MTPLVDYLIAHRGAPAVSGTLYDYVLAGDGVYLGAENSHLYARVPVATGSVRGLADVGAAFSLKHGRIPHSMWDAISCRCLLDTADHREVMLAVSWSQRGYELTLPPQSGTASEVSYTPQPDTLLQAHSHHCLPAYFSETDNSDEQGLGLYGVLGKLDTSCPEVAVRLGAYGHFLPLAWEWVFEGDRQPFRDVHFDCSQTSEQGVRLQ